MILFDDLGDELAELKALNKNNLTKYSAYKLIYLLGKLERLEEQEAAIHFIRERFTSYRNLDHLCQSATFFGSPNVKVLRDVEGRYRVIDCNVNYQGENRKKVLFITFGKVSSQVDHIPFAYPFLVNEGYKHIHIAQHRKTSYQELNLSDFEKILRPFLDEFDACFTYGVSLGGYAALYFGVGIGAIPIAASPRLPIFPENQRFKEFKENSHWDEIEFVHEDFRNLRCKSEEAVILYDPMDEVDSNFVHNYILHGNINKFQLFTIKHSGHAPLKHLAKKGEIKKFVRDIVSGYSTKHDK